MKKLRTIVSISALLLAFTINAETRVIYGDDDRLDLFEVSDNLHIELARSTAAMIPSSSISKTAQGYRLKGKKLTERGET